MEDKAIKQTQDYEAFSGMLREALDKVPDEYMYVPVLGRSQPIYRERVFCYELYHQLRCLWGSFPYTLAGELDKAGHSLIGNNAKPDFLIHRPGSMRGNFIAMEVKPAIAPVRKLVDDLVTLNWFVSEANYAFGLLLIYGDNADIKKLSDPVITARDAFGANIGVLCYPRPMCHDRGCLTESEDDE